MDAIAKVGLTQSVSILSPPSLYLFVFFSLTRILSIYHRNIWRNGWKRKNCQVVVVVVVEDSVEEERTGPEAEPPAATAVGILLIVFARPNEGERSWGEDLAARTGEAVHA